LAVRETERERKREEERERDGAKETCRERIACGKEREGVCELSGEETFNPVFRKCVKSE
jgi:hypothetical protein